MPPRKPLVTLSLESLPSPPSEVSDDSDVLQRRWYHHIPPCGIVVLIIAPHPSLLYVLVDYHLLTLRRPLLFATHLLITYTLTFLALSSLLVCVVRDPGPANFTPASNGEDSDDMGLTEALMADIGPPTPGRWCRKCLAPKPERTHHCSQCGRCVLKMDHHCPWLGFRCIGHRTYPAFIHFLCSVTLLSTYVAVMSISALWYAFHNPFTIHETTPVHELILAFAGITFALIIGSFFAYHVYLVLTNQTTVENLSPFLLLRHLPPLPRTGHSLSDPPLEPELSYVQRRLVKDAHREILLYDVGWRKNWAQVFGWNRRFGWLYRVWCGGASTGDGKYFPRNPRAEEMMVRLGTELVKADRNH